MRISLLVALAVLTVTSAASAATLTTFRIAATGDGSIGATNFTLTAFEFTLVGDTSSLTGSPTDSIALLESASFKVGTSTGTIEIPTTFGVNNNIVYFGRAGGLDMFDFILDDPIRLNTQFGPLLSIAIFALPQFRNIATSAGLLTITGVGPVIFNGGAVATGVVPEPAIWMMMVGGFGLIGAAVRQRRPSAPPARHTVDPSL